MALRPSLGAASMHVAALRRMVPAILCATLALGPGAAEAKTFRDWRSECRAADHRDCVLASNVIDHRKAWLAGLVVKPSEDGVGGIMQIVTPPGVHLASGIFIAIGTGRHRPAEFQRCSNDGCLALLPLDADALTALRRATTAEIVYRPRSTTAPVRFRASLMGFSAALAHLLETRS